MYQIRESMSKAQNTQHNKSTMYGLIPSRESFLAHGKYPVILDLGQKVNDDSNSACFTNKDLFRALSTQHASLPL